jgi:hypothetical protein
MTEQKSKSGRGGKRPGAGRKPGSVNRTTAIRQALKGPQEIKRSAGQRAVTAAEILASVDEVRLWVSLLRCADPKVRRDARTFLINQRTETAKQALEAAGCAPARFKSNG